MTAATQGQAHKVAVAGIWSVGGRLAGRAIDLCSLLVLAQLLTPADFGLVAMAMSVVMLVEAVLEMPMAQPILRVEAPGDDVYDTAFTLGLLRAIAIGALVPALATPVAAFFQEPRLPPLLCALALAPMLRGSLNPRMIDFLRRYDLRREFAIDLVSKAAAFCAVTALAFATRSYWAIAAGTIVGPLVMNVMSYAFVPHRPRLSLARWRDFADVLGWNSAGQLIAAANLQMDRILLGRALPVDVLGRYSLAADLAGISHQGVVTPLQRPLIPAFSQAAGPARRGELWCKASNAILFLVGPVLIGMALLSAPLVRALLGPQWDAAAPYLFWLALAALPGLPGAALVTLAVASRQAHVPALRLLAEFAIRLPATVLGVAWYGVLGAIAARGVSALAMACFTVFAVRRLTRTPVRAQLAALWRSLAGLAAMAGALWLLGPEPPAAETGGAGRLLLALETGLILAAGAGVHLGAAFLLWRLCGRPAGIEALLAARLAALRGRRG